MQRTLCNALPAAAAAAVLAGSVFGTTARAEEQPVANIGFTSNYLFRGVSETGNDAAVFGGLDYETPLGVYVGTWLSSLGGDAERGYELDLYLGYAGVVGPLGFDVGYIYYAYPQAASDVDVDFGEVFGKLSFMNFYGIAYFVTNADDSDFEGTLSYEVGTEIPVLARTTLGGQIGYVDFDAGSEFDYAWWSVYLARSTELGDFTFAYAQNNTDEGFGDSDDPRFLVTYQMSF